MTDPILLELFKHRFAAIAEEMGVVLQRTSYSPNIKERLDFSCAVFNAAGEMVAQAAHIPVHLGAMPGSVAAALDKLDFAPGDVVILNNPFQGGSHLPDVTMISPVFQGELAGFVASRAHHADVGGMSPGSMPLSTEIYQEGIVIPPVKLVSAGTLNQALLDVLLANVRTVEERSGDLRAQLAANHKGAARFLALVNRYAEAKAYMTELLNYAERMTRNLIVGLPDGRYTFEDFMDDDGVGSGPVQIAVAITIDGDEATVDFTGTAAQVRGSINTVYAVTLSAVLYVFRALVGLDIPANSGCLVPIRVIAPEGTLINARPPAAVAGGNVETSQRIVDVLLGALAQASPDKVPAASQGTMNNLLIGGWNAARKQPYTYYETIGGGTGAGQSHPGTDATQCHMTNTLNTPIEALEYAYPFRVRRYEIRRQSGGEGQQRGGNGLIREVALDSEAQVTLLTERRDIAPYGVAGGEAGQPGKNVLIRDGAETTLPGKTTFTAHPGDILRVETPGGGGYGTP